MSSRDTIDQLFEESGSTIPRIPGLPEPTHQDADLSSLERASLARDYIEQEVGRHDWERNWNSHKEKFGKDGTLRKRVSDWLKYYEIDHDPDGLIDYIDTDLMSRPGRWL